LDDKIECRSVEEGRRNGGTEEQRNRGTEERRNGGTEGGGGTEYPILLLKNARSS